MGSGQKLCGTCEYWLGQRQPDYFGGSVILPEQSINGKCGCLNCPFARSERLSNTCACSNYKKWSVLK